MPARKFSGPIESIVGTSCPGKSYCGVDHCFRTGGSCGNSKSDSCCMTVDMANDLVNDLGCSGGKLYAANLSKLSKSNVKFAEGTNYNAEIASCALSLTLDSKDTDYLCKGVGGTPDCLSKMCKLGCTSASCPVTPVAPINLKNTVCETIQQYCDILDPSILVDPVYNKLCCLTDLESGVIVRTVCGCPGNPCTTSTKDRNVFNLKLEAANYYNDLIIKGEPQSTTTPPAQSPTPPAQSTTTPPAQSTTTPPAQSTTTPPAQSTTTPPAPIASKSGNRTVLTVIVSSVVFVIVAALAYIIYLYYTRQKMLSASNIRTE